MLDSSYISLESYSDSYHITFFTSVNCIFLFSDCWILVPVSSRSILPKKIHCLKVPLHQANKVSIEFDCDCDCFNYEFGEALENTRIVLFFERWAMGKATVLT